MVAIHFGIRAAIATFSASEDSFFSVVLVFVEQVANFDTH